MVHGLRTSPYWAKLSVSQMKSLSSTSTFATLRITDHVLTTFSLDTIVPITNNIAKFRFTLGKIVRIIVDVSEIKFNLSKFFCINDDILQVKFCLPKIVCNTDWRPALQRPNPQMSIFPCYLGSSTLAKPMFTHMTEVQEGIKLLSLAFSQYWFCLLNKIRHGHPLPCGYVHGFGGFGLYKIDP